MPKLELTLRKKQYSCSYSICGIGEKCLLIYPGFGQKKEDYHGLNHLFPNYKIVVFDLFDHGESSEVKQWGNLVELYLMAFDALKSNEKFNSVEILGFSIGTRVASIITSQRSEYVGKLFLVAPDVAPEPLLFKLTMRTPLRFVFYFFIYFYWPGIVLLWLLKLCFRSPFSFYYRLWRQKKYRSRLRNVWSGLRNSRNNINWSSVMRKLKVYVLKNEEILSNQDIRLYFESLEVSVEELNIGHFEFPFKLQKPFLES